jgi:hypothetical protein
MKKETKKLTLTKDTLKALSGVRTGVKAGLGIGSEAICHPHSGMSQCMPCPK